MGFLPPIAAKERIILNRHDRDFVCRRLYSELSQKNLRLFVGHVGLVRTPQSSGKVARKLHAHAAHAIHGRSGRANLNNLI
jgi:hypothetical protein